MMTINHKMALSLFNKFLQQISSKDYLEDLLMKVLSTTTFEMLTHNIGMWRLKYLHEREQIYFIALELLDYMNYVSFFLHYNFFLIGFFPSKVLMRYIILYVMDI